MDAEALRLVIRSKLNDRRLPYSSIPRFWGGPGDGEQCDACDMRITKEQLVMECGIASTHTDEKPIQFHVKCFYIWDAVRMDVVGRDSIFAADIARVAWR
jgi:hypothetical protein